MKVLIVEDDQQVRQLLSDNLTSASHTVETADNGADGSFLGRNFNYDAIILDYSLPKKNGLEVCSEIRKEGKTTPIIFLSMNDTEATKVQAFENGADDYVTKPFSFKEIQSRLRAITRRAQEIKPNIIKVHDLTLDVSKGSIMRGDKELKLTNKEYSLLEYLMNHPSMVISRTALMEHVWSSENDPFSNTVEAHIGNLRRKLNVGGKPDMIKNISGRGYILDVPKETKQNSNKDVKKAL